MFHSPAYLGGYYKLLHQFPTYGSLTPRHFTTASAQWRIFHPTSSGYNNYNGYNWGVDDGLVFKACTVRQCTDKMGYAPPGQPWFYQGGWELSYPCFCLLLRCTQSSGWATMPDLHVLTESGKGRRDNESPSRRRGKQCQAAISLTQATHAQRQSGLFRRTHALCNALLLVPPSSFLASFRCQPGFYPGGRL